jgi:hypothetical protein
MTRDGDPIIRGLAAGVREGRVAAREAGWYRDGDCTAKAADGTSVVMRPFMKIQEESYVTCVSVKS